MFSIWKNAIILQFVLQKKKFRKKYYINYFINITFTWYYCIISTFPALTALHKHANKSDYDSINNMNILKNNYKG